MIAYNEDQQGALGCMVVGFLLMLLLLAGLFVFGGSASCDQVGDGYFSVQEGGHNYCENSKGDRVDNG